MNKNLSTVEEFQSFIDENNILSRYDFYKRYRSVRNQSKKLGLYDKLNFSKGRKHIYKFLKDL
jgi:hypothetical protein